MAIIPNNFLNSVVSIGIKRKDDNISWIGTGFFVVRRVSKTSAKPFLVTNKHVVEGLEEIQIRMRKKDSEDLDIFHVQLKNDNGVLYKTHPTADICVIEINGGVIQNHNIDFDAFDIDQNALSSSELRSEGVDEGSLVYMLGYPMGLVNETSGLPICRLGCIARISEAQIREQQNILVDIQNFPGNSGSPIVTRPEIIATGHTKAFDKCAVVGIIHSYIPYQEELLNTQTNRIVEIRSENSGIANVHPVEFIREIIDTIQPCVDIE